MSEHHDHGRDRDSGHGGGHEHYLPFWRKYIFSVDHKTIGIQYAVTGLLFLLFGFTLMLMMRYTLAYPVTQANRAPEFLEAIVGLLGGLFNKASLLFSGQDSASLWTAGSEDIGGYISSDFYNTLGAMHGTIMVFMGVVPLAVGGFGNYVLPLQIGAPDMAFPKLNMLSYWAFFAGCVVMAVSFFLPESAAKSGWTSYPPLSVIDIGHAQTLWLIGMVLLITSSLLGSVNFIVTVVQLRTEGLTFFRLPFFVWAQFVTSFLLLLAFPPLEAAGVLQLADRVLGTSFFLPSGLAISGVPLDATGGGNPLLWQHLFWFLAHPEVYVLILPAMGIVGEIIANNTRKPLWGYRTLVYSVIALGFLSFVVWAHHMFMTGMGVKMSTFFQITTMAISIPSVIILTCFVLSLWGASLRFNTPMLFAIAFLPMFAIGGLTGLPLGLTTPDIHFHDTYYVIGHFHYVVAPGTLFALFAGIYYWFPKATGRKMNEFLGWTHFTISFVAMNAIFMPMLFAGMTGMLRRGYDPSIYRYIDKAQIWTMMTSWGAFLLALGQVPFIVNFFWSMFAGKKVESDNPWQATTLEWAAPSPPPHGNFIEVPAVYREPYEYSNPARPESDFWPQFAPEEAR